MEEGAEELDDATMDGNDMLTLLASLLDELSLTACAVDVDLQSLCVGGGELEAEPSLLYSGTVAGDTIAATFSPAEISIDVSPMSQTTVPVVISSRQTTDDSSSAVAAVPFTAASLNVIRCLSFITDYRARSSVFQANYR